MHALISGMAVGDEPSDLIKEQSGRKRAMCAVIPIYLAFGKNENSALENSGRERNIYGKIM